jgi:hypothetical protein
MTRSENAKPDVETLTQYDRTARSATNVRYCPYLRQWHRVSHEVGKLDRPQPGAPITGGQVIGRWALQIDGGTSRLEPPSSFDNRTNRAFKAFSISPEKCPPYRRNRGYDSALLVAIFITYSCLFSKQNPVIFKNSDSAMRNRLLTAITVAAINIGGCSAESPNTHSLSLGSNSAFSPDEIEQLPSILISKDTNHLSSTETQIQR